MQRMLFAVAIAAAAVCAPHWCQAGEQEDQDAAQRIANVLRDSGKVQNYSIGVKYTDGIVSLAGRVTSEAQMQAVLDVVGGIQGVSQIVNNLEVGSAKARKKKSRPAAAMSGAGPLTASQASAQMPVAGGGMNSLAIGAPPPMPAAPQRRVPRTTTASSHKHLPSAEMVPAGVSYGPGAPTPMPAYVPGTGGGVAPAAYDRPSLPNYSWPSYAAYPNYAAVTYPRQYSATAWPFIGPFYPYPQVPMGWRKVSLEWDDGWWFLDFHDRSCQ